MDAFGAYITVSHNGQEVECYMDRDEAKVRHFKRLSLRVFFLSEDAVGEWSRGSRSAEAQKLLTAVAGHGCVHYN